MNKDNKQKELVKEEVKMKEKKPQDKSGIKVEGHIKIWDPTSGEIIVDKRNG